MRALDSPKDDRASMRSRGRQTTPRSRTQAVESGRRAPMPPLDAENCYRALATHDARFDGRFFVGVRTTRIYCRPVCTVRLPRRENCRFFRSAAAAEVAGFRPCLRCRPELAPGLARVDASAQFAKAAVAMIEDGALCDTGIETLAARIGITSRHLRRVFEAEFGVSPIEYAQTQRLLLAKHLLTDTSLPVVDVALASGFRSVRRFNALIRERYRMAPSRLRRDGAPATLPSAMAFELGYRPPYAWDAMLAFLRARAVPGIERADDTTYCRTVSLRHRDAEASGWIAVARSRARATLSVQVSASLAPVVAAVLSRVRNAFDCACDPEPIAARLGSLAERHPGLRVPGTCDGFELAVRAIVGQQVSVAGARTLLGRLVRDLGIPLSGAGPCGLTHAFPSAATLSLCPIDALRGVGLTRARAGTLRGLAEAVMHGDIALDAGADVERTRRALEAIPGIGPWTSGYIAMRALGWPDAFLDNDLVVLRALGETRPARARARSEMWRPWRAYAVMHLWANA